MKVIVVDPEPVNVLPIFIVELGNTLTRIHSGGSLVDPSKSIVVTVPSVIVSGRVIRSAYPYPKKREKLRLVSERVKFNKVKLWRRKSYPPMAAPEHGGTHESVNHHRITRLTYVFSWHIQYDSRF